MVEKNFVLTAGHCVKEDDNLDNHFVVVGSTKVTDSSEEHRVEIPFDSGDVFAHPKYPQVIIIKSFCI